MDRRQQLIAVFEDTQAYYRQNVLLAQAVQAAKDGTTFYEANDYPALGSSAALDGVSVLSGSSALANPPALNDSSKLIDPPVRNDSTVSNGYVQAEGTVTVTRHKAFEAAMEIHRTHPEWRIAILNFASATNPGGRVKTGSSAQEESICRCSTLYPTLTQNWLWQMFYQKNRDKHDNLHTDDCIYSPGIVICKTDTALPERLDKKDFVTVDVISCAAPNLRRKPGTVHNPEYGRAVVISDTELYDLHLKRAKHIMHIAAARQVNALVLGAFGCGAFANNPNVVAAAYRDAVREYKNRFRLIEFAVYCKDYETENYDAFRKMLM